MITSKQRSELKKIAQQLSPALTIGKDNLNQNTFLAIESYLNKNEIMKIKLLQNCSLPPKDAINEICLKLNAEPVLCVGRTIIVYKLSNDKKVKHILG